MLSQYFSVSSPSLGPLHLKKVKAALVYQILVLQAQVSRCSRETQVSLSLKPSKEHPPV